MNLSLDLSAIQKYNCDFEDYSSRKNSQEGAIKKEGSFYATDEEYNGVLNETHKDGTIIPKYETEERNGWNPQTCPIDFAIDTIKSLYELYKDDAYMFSKTHNYICYQLPSILETMKKTHTERQQRVEELTAEQDAFIQSFMNLHQYFYCQSTEIFFKYDAINYSVIKEDDILYHILTTISREKQLMSWKQRTKVYIIKRIKDASILKSIPETETIQMVLDAIYPAIFESKADAKYFLTLVGDIVFRKNGDKLYFVNSDAKHFIRELSNISVLLFGANIGNSLKLKYYQHNYENSRLVRIRKQVREKIWLPIIQAQAINILVVSCHYSIRYENADQYALEYSNDEDLINYSFYLKEKSQEDIVADFSEKYLHKCEPSVDKSLSWENVRYLWKQYLEKLNLPNIMFQNTLKTILTNKYTYNEVNDVFMNITSDYLPSIQKFLSFWNETITYDEEYSMNEYEIEELCGLYRKWCVNKKLSYHHFVIGDKQMIDYITFYFPHTEIEQDKYVYKIRCDIWDKQLDVQTSIEQLREYLRNNMLIKDNETGGITTTSQHNTSPLSKCFTRSASAEKMHYYDASSSTGVDTSANYLLPSISIYDAYLWYCTQGKQTKTMLVSKLYFEKYVVESLSSYIIDNKYISISWWGMY
jgi:hypothetical protein